MLEDQKVLKTTRIVPYDLREQESAEKELAELGWSWLTDPEGRTFYINKNTGEKSWDTPMRFKEVEEQETVPVGVSRRRLNGKQPPPQYLKEMKLKRLEVDEGEAEVTKTSSLHEVNKHLEDWKDSLKGEWNLNMEKDV